MYFMGDRKYREMIIMEAREAKWKRSRTSGGFRIQQLSLSRLLLGGFTLLQESMSFLTEQGGGECRGQSAKIGGVKAPL